MVFSFKAVLILFSSFLGTSQKDVAPIGYSMKDSLKWLCEVTTLSWVNLSNKNIFRDVKKVKADSKHHCIKSEFLKEGLRNADFSAHNLQEHDN